MKNFEINKSRIRVLKKAEFGVGAVVYWMQRDQRIQDNWALLAAQKTAIRQNKNLIVVFCLVDNFLNASFRQYDFMIKGLEEIDSNLKNYNIPFKLLVGLPIKEIPKFLKEINAGCLFTDFNPLSIIKHWQNEVSKKIKIPFYQVDTHNIVPCWITSDKVEFAARTIRPKILNRLSEYLEPFPKLKKMEPRTKIDYKNNWGEVYSGLNINYDVKPIGWLVPGEQAAKAVLKIFINKKFAGYNINRNDPNIDAQSNLSPYLHFGQISSQRIALKINKLDRDHDSKVSFLEELIVRKELSDNYCNYSESYDTFEGFHSWAKKTLLDHYEDQREYIYSQDIFEQSQTHDPLWNAAQTEMVTTGKMHGFMRMYWAKKILEWSSSPIEAQSIAIYLNDKYSVDGRDPNGYTGIAWSIGGVHDRAWSERKVYGKIRYMNFNGCKRKFSVEKYIYKYS